MPTEVGDVWPVCAEQSRVVVAVAHSAMGALIVALLARERGCWDASAVRGMAELREALSSRPDLVVVDAADFGACCREVCGSFPLDRVVVIGPEPDPAYRQAVLDRGAGAWLSRDRVADELSAKLRQALGWSTDSARGPHRGPAPVVRSTQRGHP